MSSAGSVLAARVAAALVDSDVAAAAGIASGTWASVLAPRVFRGIGQFCLGKCRGRLPFVEYQVEGQSFEHESPEGGTIMQTIRLRAHCGGRDLGVADNLLLGILGASMAAIRDGTVDNLVALGDEGIGPMDAGPWGHAREATMTVEQTYARADYEVT